MQLINTLFKELKTREIPKRDNELILSLFRYHKRNGLTQKQINLLKEIHSRHCLNFKKESKKNKSLEEFSQQKNKKEVKK